MVFSRIYQVPCIAEKSDEVNKRVKGKAWLEQSFYSYGPPHPFLLKYFQFLLEDAQNEQGKEDAQKEAQKKEPKNENVMLRFY